VHNIHYLPENPRHYLVILHKVVMHAMGFTCVILPAIDWFRQLSLNNFLAGSAE
jgi:hypothetical protein